MRRNRRFWLAIAVAAITLPLGAAGLAGTAHHAAGQAEPHGSLPTNQIPIQVRPFHGADAALTPEPHRHGSAAPGEQGVDHGQGHGDPAATPQPDNGDGQ